MHNFKLTDKHRAFAGAISGGMEQTEAYLKYMESKASWNSAKAMASKLAAKPEIKDLIATLQKERTQALIKANSEDLPAEFTGIALTVDQLDSLHYSIVRGVVEVEEVVVVHNISEEVNEQGRVTKRKKTPTFMRVKRKPNIRERQASLDALYKRFGNYAPTKGIVGIGNVGREEDEADETNLKRYVLLSNGEKIEF